MPFFSAGMCFYGKKAYPTGDPIPTLDPCLSCSCVLRSVVCHLRICPHENDVVSFKIHYFTFQKIVVLMTFLSADARLSSVATCWRRVLFRALLWWVPLQHFLFNWDFQIFDGWQNWTLIVGRRRFYLKISKFYTVSIREAGIFAVYWLHYSLTRLLAIRKKLKKSILR